MANPAFDDHVGAHEAKLYKEAAGEVVVAHLLWGDGVHFVGESRDGRREVRARHRTRTGWIDEADPGGQSLLEIYFIDVGQGDGVLVKTPDFRHVVIDGGHPRRSQNAGKSAADFIDWKFFHDYRMDRIELDAMIASHNDYDHYGGLDDLLDVAQTDELDTRGISVEAFYHAGVSWWVGDDGKRTLGRNHSVGDRRWLVELLNDRASAEAGTDSAAGARQLQGAWGEFIGKVVGATTRSGAATPISRLSWRSGDLPGFGGDGAPRIRILGPIDEDLGEAGTGVPDLRSASQSTNGNSVLLRLDHGRTRVLLTGDLNKSSQKLLLGAYGERRSEFECDVAKACHHGSADVSMTFLQAMRPAATIMSSGDGEGHDHPRPAIVAASGATGHLTIENDEIVTPLVYSTEIARSCLLGRPYELALSDQAGGAVVAGAALGTSDIRFRVTEPGALRDRKGVRKVGRSRVVAKFVYGLVNMRTDGETILLATLNEGDGTWATRSFKSRF